jgi:hypothetical protein
MPRTGTASLSEALGILGFNAIHHRPERLDLDTLGPDSFRVYDDVDAVVDMPAAFFYREIGRRGVEKYILTVRCDVDAWWESMKAHANTIRCSADQGHIRYSERLHGLLFGWPVPHEFLWKRRALEWDQNVYTDLRDLGRERFLVVDICAGDKWEKLCPFLDVPVPNVEFPWKNKKNA